MTRIELPPTKSSLRKIKEDLAFAYEGHDLLNQKREILAMEIMKKVSVIRKMEEEFLILLRSLYDSWRNAAFDMGTQAAILKSASEKKNWELQLVHTRFMGLKLPQFVLSAQPFSPPDSPWGSTASYDTAKREALKVLGILVQYAALSREVILLSRELKKVQRRVNALEKLFIPPHEEAKKFIVDRLEEMEREEVYVKKLLRQRMGSE